jgi:hypothetical protein
LPDWLFGASLLIIGTTHPMLWVLDWADIYPAAIASAQALFIAGLYFAIPILDGTKQQPWRYLITGILWGLTLGTRLTLLLAILFLCTMVGYATYSKHRNADSASRSSTKIGLVLSPLILSLVLLGLYNYSRFGNVFETGLQYQVSKLNHKYLFEEGLTFNINYVLPNALYYLLAPLQFQPSFPFIRPLFEALPTFSNIAELLRIPGGNMLQNATGVFFFMPSIYFFGLSAWSRIRMTRLQRHKQSPPGDSWEETHGLRLNRLILIIGASAILAGLPLLFYFWVANRFLLDFIPLLALISAVSIWYVYRSNRFTIIRRVYFSVTILITIAASYGISLLLSLTGAWSRFDDINPVFWENLIDFFS